MNNLMKFSDSEFGELNVLEIDGKMYFPATACAVYPFAHLPRGNALPPQALLSRQVRTSETEVIPSQSTIAALRLSAGEKASLP